MFCSSFLQVEKGPQDGRTICDENTESKSFDRKETHTFSLLSFVVFVAVTCCKNCVCLKKPPGPVEPPLLD